MRQEIQGQGLHTESVNLPEIQIGDSVLFPTKGETKNEKQIDTLGWEHLAYLNREAAEIHLMREHPNSIFNIKGESSAGSRPSKMAEWQIGIGIVIEAPLTFAYEEKIVVLCRSGKDIYQLLKSRDVRDSERFG
jgi:hypothetical protein